MTHKNIFDGKNLFLRKIFDRMTVCGRIELNTEYHYVTSKTVIHVFIIDLRKHTDKLNKFKATPNNVFQAL